MYGRQKQAGRTAAIGIDPLFCGGTARAAKDMVGVHLKYGTFLFPAPCDA